MGWLLGGTALVVCLLQLCWPAYGEDCVSADLTKLPHSSFTSSSAAPYHEAWDVHGNVSSPRTTWCPLKAVTQNPGEYIQIDLGRMYNISALRLWGDFNQGFGTIFTSRLQLKYQRAKSGQYKQYEGVIRGNTNAIKIETGHLDRGFVLARTIMIYPLAQENIELEEVCLGLALLEACPTNGVAAYTIPQGETMTVTNGGTQEDIKLFDFGYDGVDGGHVLRHGLGQLTDGAEGADKVQDSVKTDNNLTGYAWVGWSKANNPDGVTLVFEFDRVRNFSQILLRTSNELVLGVEVFRRAEVGFSIGGRIYGDKPAIYDHLADPMSQHPRQVNLLTGKKARVARFIEIKLFHASEWILLSEVDFVSVISSGIHAPEEDSGSTPPDDGTGGTGGTSNIGGPPNDIPQEAAELDNNTIGIIVGSCTAVLLLAIALVVYACVYCRRKRAKRRDAASSPTSSSSSADGPPYKLSATAAPPGYNGLPTSDKEGEAVYDEPWVHSHHPGGHPPPGMMFATHGGSRHGAPGYAPGHHGTNGHHGDVNHQSSGYTSEGAQSQTALTAGHPGYHPHAHHEGHHGPQGTMTMSTGREYAVPEIGPPLSAPPAGYQGATGVPHPTVSAFHRPAQTLQHHYPYHPQQNNNNAGLGGEGGWGVPAAGPGPHNAVMYPSPAMTAPHGYQYHTEGHPHPFQHQPQCHDHNGQQFFPVNGSSPMLNESREAPGDFMMVNMGGDGVHPPANISIQGASGNSVYASAFELAGGAGATMVHGGPGYHGNPQAVPLQDYPLVEIPKQNLKVVDRLGVGQFGEVNLCEAYNMGELVSLDNNERPTPDQPILVAVKVLKLTAGSAALQNFEREMRLLGRLRDPNVVRLLGVSTAEKPECMIVEYMPLGDLHEFLNRHRPAEGAVEDPHDRQDQQLTLSRGCLIHMASQIASGMKYLAGQHMVHRDLAARNCLVGPRYSIKVSDFGMSRSLYSSDYYRIEGKVVLPIRWMAWESILLGKFTPYSDVWSFGVTLWEILTFARGQPYTGITDEQVIANCSHFYRNDGQQLYLDRPGAESEGTGRPSSSAVCPKEVYDLMKECWNHEDTERPAFGEIHLFLQRKNIGYRPEHEPTYGLYCGAEVAAGGASVESGSGVGEGPASLSVSPRAAVEEGYDMQQDHGVDEDHVTDQSGNASTAVVGSDSPGSHSGIVPADV